MYICKYSEEKEKQNGGGFHIIDPSNLNDDDKKEDYFSPCLELCPGPELYYTTKTRYPKIQPEIDYDGISKMKFSRPMMMLLLAKRLGGVFTLDEQYLLNKKLHVPVSFDIEDGAKSFHSLSRLRTLVKAWKRENTEAFSDEEFRQIVQEINKGLSRLEKKLPTIREVPEDNLGFELPDELVEDEFVDKEDKKKKAELYVHWTEDHQPLPGFTSYMFNGTGKLVGQMTIIDCAASYSILTHDDFRALGLSESVLDTTMKCKVKTAAGILGNKTENAWQY